MKKSAGEPSIEKFLDGKSAHTLMLYHHFITAFQQAGPVTLRATKTMIGIRNGQRNIAWINALGKNFIHAVFIFKQPYPDNLCFVKIAQVPGIEQYNHHFRMLFPEDVTGEVRSFMQLAFAQ